jgi:hypothetical protein
MTRASLLPATALVAVALASCGSTGTTAPVDPDAMAAPCDASCPDPAECAPCDCGFDAPDLPPTEASPSDTPPAGCSAWEADLAAANLASLRRFALYRATAIVTGTPGTPVKVQDQTYVPLHVIEVRRGLAFLQGMDVLVPLHADAVAALPASPRWTVALSQHFPSHWEGVDQPVWGNATAWIPEPDLTAFPEVAGWRLPPGGIAAVVRIASQDEYRTTFEVVDALAGTFPPSFSDNWYASWKLPYPGLGCCEGALWMATVTGLTKYPADGVTIGTVVDFRPATPEAVASVIGVLAHPSEPYDRERLRRFRDVHRDSFRFHLAPFVVSSVVTGRAEECCTDAGGTYVEHATTEVLRGEGSPDRFVTGGHAWYGGEECGDALLQGLDSFADVSALPPDPFDCLEYPAGAAWPAWDEKITSPVAVRLPWSPENRAEVESWVAASPPLLRLMRPEAAVASAALAQDPANAPWSRPVDAVEAFLAATHAALFVVDYAVHDDTDDHWEVVLSTTFAMHEYSHLTKYEVKVAFRCGDPRLHQVGARWVAPMVLLDPWSWDPATGPDLDRAFIVPGVLVPESVLGDQIANDLATFLQT